jgi:hypothetical protein
MSVPILAYYKTTEDVLFGYFQAFEQFLDRVGYVPIASTISGGIRIDYGLCQMILGVALAILWIIPSTCVKNFEAAYWSALEIVVHGAGNVVRGMVECHRWINCLCFLHDKFVRKEQSLRLKYTAPLWK